MEEYKPNSHKYRETQSNGKRIEKVITGKTKKKKKNEIQKFADVFISEDVENVKSYILMDILVPAMKKAISDIVTNGIDMILYGETGRSEKKSAASKIHYAKCFDGRDERKNYISNRTREGFDYDNIIFSNRGDAEAVLNAMEDIIEQFGIVCVGDLYDLSDISTTNYMVQKYGWTNIRSAQVIRVRDGYLLKLPRALPLD